MAYDMSDPAIRRMIEINHTPTETYNNQYFLTRIICDTCHDEWPCRAITELRNWGQKRREYLSSQIEKENDGD